MQRRGGDSNGDQKHGGLWGGDSGGDIKHRGGLGVTVVVTLTAGGDNSGGNQKHRGSWEGDGDTTRGGSWQCHRCPHLSLRPCCALLRPTAVPICPLALQCSRCTRRLWGQQGHLRVTSVCPQRWGGLGVTLTWPCGPRGPAEPLWLLGTEEGGKVGTCPHMGTLGDVGTLGTFKDVGTFGGFGALGSLGSMGTTGSVGDTGDI